MDRDAEIDDDRDRRARVSVLSDVSRVLDLKGFLATHTALMMTISLSTYSLSMSIHVHVSQ